MATRTPLILNQTTARIEELAAADTLPGSAIDGFLGKNMLINGNMGIFQRSTLANRPDGESYTVDRWSFASLGTGTSNWGVGTFLISDGTPLLPVPSPPRYWIGLNVVANTTSALFRQKIENVSVYANGKATLSFWMRSSVAGKKVGVRIIQDFGSGSGASSAVFVEGPVFTLSTSFQKFTATFDVPSLVGKTVGATPTNDCLQVLFDFAAASGYGGQLVGQTGLFEVTLIQFERGEVATDFERRPEAMELALCQRYCQLLDYGKGNGFTGVTVIGSTQVLGFVNLMANMRTVPTATRRGDLPTFTGPGSDVGGALTSLTLIPIGTGRLAFVGVVGTASTIYQAGYVGSTSVNGLQILLDAEI